MVYNFWATTFLQSTGSSHEGNSCPTFRQAVGRLKLYLFQITYLIEILFQSESSVSVSGNYLGYKASLKVDVKAFKESMSQGTKFGEHKVVFKSGGPDLPEPIGLKLVPIDEAFDVNFYEVIDQHQSSRCVHSDSLLRTRKVHVQKALEEYPRLKKAQTPVGKLNGPFATNGHIRTGTPKTKKIKV